MSVYASALADRYATALFDAVIEADALTEAEKDAASLRALAADSAPLQELMKNALISRAEKLASMQDIAKKAGYCPSVANFAALLAENGRLQELPSILAVFSDKCATYRGEIRVEVTAQKALTKKQRTALEKTLTDMLKGKIALNETVSPDLLGGLALRIGSYSIDSSLKTKLKRLQTAMKGVA